MTYYCLISHPERLRGSLGTLGLGRLGQFQSDADRARSPGLLRAGAAPLWLPLDPWRPARHLSTWFAPAASWLGGLGWSDPRGLFSLGMILPLGSVTTSSGVAGGVGQFSKASLSMHKCVSRAVGAGNHCPRSTSLLTPCSKHRETVEPASCDVFSCLMSSGLPFPQ